MGLSSCAYINTYTQQLPEWKKPLGDICNCVEGRSYNLDLKQTWCEIVDLIYLPDDRNHWSDVENAVMKCRVG